MSLTRCFWVTYKSLPTGDHSNLIIRYNVVVRLRKPCSHIFYLEGNTMYSYKLNNSYTVYVNYTYLNDCIKASMHTAVASGSWCGAERQRCGASGSPLM